MGKISVRSAITTLFVVFLLFAACGVSEAGECGKCNRTVQPDWNYCPWCGVKLECRCPECDKPVTDPAWKFCPHCQSPLKKVPEKAESSKPEAVKEPKETQEKKAGTTQKEKESARKEQPESKGPEEPLKKAEPQAKEKEPSLPKKDPKPEQAEPSRVCESFITAIINNDRLDLNRIIDWNALYENMCEDKKSKDLEAFKTDFLNRHFEESNRTALSRMTRTDADFLVKSRTATLVYHYRISPRALKKRVYTFSLVMKPPGDWYITKVIKTLEPNR